MGATEVAQAAEAWCAVDAAGNICRANGASATCLGAAPTGQPAAALFGPALGAALDRVRASGQPEVVEDTRALRWLVSRQGDEVHCVGLQGPLGLAGRALGLVATGAPLTEVLRAVTRDAADSWPGTHCVVELWDADGPMLVAAAPGPAPRGSPLLEAVPAPGLYELEPTSAAVKSLGAPQGLDHGSLLAFEVTGPSLHGAVALFRRAEAGAPPGALPALASLVSAAARAWDAERRSREVSERLRLLTEATPHAIYDWDLESDVMQWTARLSDLFGLAPPPEGSHAAWWRRHLHPDDEGRVQHGLERALAHKERFWTCEYRIRCADGRYAWVFDRGALVYGAHRRATRMVGVMEDLGRGREPQSQLGLAARLATMGSLASGIAHELNSPLTWVTSNLGFAVEELHKLLREHEDATERTEEALDALEDAKVGAERIAQIVADLRTFARSDSDGARPVSVNHAVDAALAMASHELRHRGRLVRESDRVPPVLANEARLAQAVLNLLLNAAWSLAERPGCDNEVRVSTRTDAQGRAVIEVRDTGPGIPSDMLPRIFDPLFTTKPTGAGLGLGLSVTHGIISGFGGAIEVESTPGRGSTFRVVLPAQPEEPLDPIKSS
jgi:PAS domain S-box-containing protein